MWFENCSAKVYENVPLQLRFLVRKLALFIRTGNNIFIAYLGEKRRQTEDGAVIHDDSQT